MEALWLRSHGLSHSSICKLTNITSATLCKYLTQYKEGGIESLKRLNFYQPQSILWNYSDTIEEYFRKHPPASIKEAMAKIEDLTGIKRSDTQVRRFLKVLGLKLRKVGMIPAKADPVKQKIF